MNDDWITHKRSIHKAKVTGIKQPPFRQLLITYRDVGGGPTKGF